MKKEKIGFFGGCFNPPINTHISLANNLIKDNIVDKVMFVPVGDYYQKKNLVEARHRYNMLKLATQEFPKLQVENIASTHKDKLFATDTFKLIYDKYSNSADMYLIMGSDNFEKMPTWKNYADIINKYKFIVIERPKYEEKCDLKNVIYCKDNQLEDITSTRIRNNLQKGEDVSNWINADVLKYINENKLYA